jgi:HicA toxin of bacterial toxin-antitoxin,
MSKTAKLIEKLINSNVVMTWDELATLLGRLGYKLNQGDGSRVKFTNGKPEEMINLHKPHPGNELKRYVKIQVIEKLKLGGYL